MQKQNEDGRYTEETIKVFLDAGFLATLKEAAQIYGNSGDWPAVEEFVCAVYRWAGKEPPNMEAYKE